MSSDLRHAEGQRRDAYADYVDRRTAARERYVSEVAEADRLYAEALNEIDNLRGHGASEERAGL